MDHPCPNCGITLEEIRKTGKLGCPKDYDVFRDYFTEVLTIIQHRLENKGKRPSNADSVIKLQRLNSQLRIAIRREDFETAATLRDQIIAEEVRPSDI